MNRERAQRIIRQIGPPALAIGIIGLTATFVEERMTFNQRTHEFNSALSDVGLSTEEYNNAQARVLAIREELDQALINGSTSQDAQAIFNNQENQQSINAVSRGIQLRNQIYSKPDKSNSSKLLVRFASVILTVVGLPSSVISFALRPQSKRTSNKLES